MKKTLIHALLFEDNPGDVRLFREFLHEDGLTQFELDPVERLKTGLEHLAHKKPDVILLDLGLPDSQGLDTFAQVYSQAPEVPIVVLTGLNDAEQAVEAVTAGAQDYLVKGEVNGGLLVRAIRYAIERKRTEESLRESEERFRSLYANATVGMYRTTPDGRILMANPSMVRMLGFDSFDQLAQRNLEQEGHDADYPRALFLGAMEGHGEIMGLEFAWHKRDGTTLFVRESARTIRDSQGQILYYDGTVEDITERKKTEDALAASEAELRALFAGLVDTVIVYDTNGRYVKIAPTSSINLYRPLDNLLHKTVHEILPKENADYIVAKIRAALQSGETVNGEYSLLINGNEIWFASSASRLSENTVIWVAHDITNRKQAEEEIRRRLNDLEVLYSSSQAIGQLIQPKEIGQKIIDILSERLQWHHASLSQYHSETETLELLAFHQPGLENEAERLAAEERFNIMVTRPGQGFAGWVIQHGQLVYCGDVTKDERYFEVWPTIHSGMYVPLNIGERTIGVLSVESERGNAFTETDEWLINTLATQAASALENARLFEETSRRLKHVQALHAVDTAISSSLNLNVTLDVFLDQAVRLLGVDAADVLRFNPYTKILEFVSGYGFRANALKHTRLRLGEGYAGMAGLERRIVQISHLASEDTGLLISPNFWSEGFETGFFVPLIAKGQLMGVLEIFHRSPLVPYHEWTEFLQTLAGQAAIAIDNITLFDDLQSSNLKLSVAYDATIEGWSRALDLRDKETAGHTLRVAELTMDLAHALSLQNDQIIHIRRGALLHDIGKMGIPDVILLKPGPLSDDEWKIMKRHPGYAYDMISPIQYLSSAVDIPYCHHEKWDGSGYPQGLNGEQIPLAARIFAVVDVYDALTSDRPYRKAWPKANALQHLLAESGKHFEPQVVEAFLKMMNTD